MEGSILPRCDVFRGNARRCLLCLRDVGEEVLVPLKGLDQHNRNLHKSCKHQCERCRLVFETLEQLGLHEHRAEDNLKMNNTIEELPRTRVFWKEKRSCILCLKEKKYEVLVQVKGIRTHNATVHSACHYICKDCGLAFENPQQLSSHRHV